MAKQQQRGLGKGLSALLGDNADLSSFRRPVQYVNNGSAAGKPAEGSVRLVPVSDIEPNPYNPRVTFDEQALAELAESIRTLGLIQPITVRSLPGSKYQIISGERRFRAGKAAGLVSIPAYIRSTDDSGMLEMAIVENVQRADLDPIETAVSFQRLIEECHLTQEQMADRIGKNRVTVTNFLRLLKLPPKVQYDLKQGNISIGHAKVLLGVEDKERQERLSDEIIRNGLSVRALEQRIKSLDELPAKNGTASAPAELTEDCSRLASILGKYFGKGISIRRTADGKGTMTIRFDTDRQLRAFLDSFPDTNI